MYTIWVPFELPPKSEIDLAQPRELDVLGYAGQFVKVLRNTGLKVVGLPTEAAARRLLDQVCASLLYASISRGPFLRIAFEPVQLVYKDADPIIYSTERFIGEDQIMPFNASGTAIYLTEKRYSEKIGYMKLSTVSPPDKLVSTFKDALSVPGLINGISDPKLRLAAELFMASGFEASDRAEFLTLCTVLEVLAPQHYMPDEVIQHLKKWANEARHLAKEDEYSDSAREAFGSISESILRLKSTSKTRNLQEYVADVIARDRKYTAGESAQEIRALYAKRGRLIHDGIELAQDDTFRLHEIVRKTLLAALRLQGT